VLVYGFADQKEMIDVELVDEMVLERMKNSVVPIMNRDIAKQKNKESSKVLEKDFPWIRPEGGTKGLKPIEELDTEIIPPIITDFIQPEISALDEAAVERHEPSKGGIEVESVAAKTETAKAVSKPATKSAVKPAARPATKPEAKPAARPEAKAEAKTKLASSETKSASSPSASRTFVEAQKNIFSADDSIESKSETRKQFIKYGLIALIFAFALIALALALNEATGSKPEVVNDEVLKLQKQQEQEAARLTQLQAEADALKKERDAALLRIEEEKQAKLEAEKIAAEKAALAIKVAEDRRRQEEQKKIADAKVRERQAKEAEARAKAEAERVKREAAALEEEKRFMKARLEEEIRLKEEQEARRMALELQEKQRLALEEEKNSAQLQADVTQAEDKANKKIECSGPTARFKSACR
jgi:colicin import membrane protein